MTKSPSFVSKISNLIKNTPEILESSSKVSLQNMLVKELNSPPPKIYDSNKSILSPGSEKWWSKEYTINKNRSSSVPILNDRIESLLKNSAAQITTGEQSLTALGTSQSRMKYKRSRQSECQLGNQSSQFKNGVLSVLQTGDQSSSVISGEKFPNLNKHQQSQENYQRFLSIQQKNDLGIVTRMSTVPSFNSPSEFEFRTQKNSSGVFTNTTDLDSFKSIGQKSNFAVQNSLRQQLKKGIDNYRAGEMMINTEIFGFPSLPQKIRQTALVVSKPKIPKITKKIQRSPEPPLITKNKENIKDYFRKVQSYHLRDIKGGDGLLPFERFDADYYKNFDRSHLTSEQKQIFDEIVMLREKIIDPYSLCEFVFSQFFDSKTPNLSARANHTQDFLVFCLKMKLISQELDYAIGARLARIILEQFDIKRQKVAQLEEIKQFDQFGIAQRFEEDLKINEHLLFLDSMMPTKSEVFGLNEDDKKRLLTISNYAATLCKQMKVPIENMFKDISRKDQLEAFKKPTKAQVAQIKEYETVVVAGLVFYLDHTNKNVQKLTPVPVFPKQGNGNHCH